MKLKAIFCIFLAFMLCSCGQESGRSSEAEVDMTLNEQTVEQLDIENSVEQSEPESKSYKPVNFEIQKAMWLTMMDYKNILYGKSEEEFTESIQKVYNNMKNMGINTVYVHVRPYNDVYYQSEIFPRAEYYSSDMDFDPLEIMVSTGHDAGLSIHAWINPLRCQTDSELQTLDDKYIIKQWYNDKDKKGKYISEVDGRWYLNPAYEEVLKYISDGVSEITENYEVDGIHIDDYFYPTAEESFDTDAFSDSGSDDLSQWRIDNINSMVKNMYSTVKNDNSEILFGISPQGNIDSNYSSQYADVKVWAGEEGYCDYIVPQVYFGFENESQPFEETVKEWINIKTCDKVQLVIGICTYKIGSEDKWAGTGKNEWIENEGIPARQAEFVFTQETDGAAVYSYGSTFEEDKKDEYSKLEAVMKN
ncbi:glycoside hydrolase family 10 protein [Porcipelethomonas sp.]|uniref:glycoside hydrolase family 10 protein n=1 Tax=Porcipelethomonas sp. TaxID=2981675 RepID=UPI003EF14E30